MKNETQTKTESHILQVSYETGTEAVERVTGLFEGFCTQETRNRELQNEAELVPLEARGSILTAERTKVQQERDRLPPEGRPPLVRRIFSWFLTALFSLAGFAFAYMALAPFALGPIVTLFAAAIGVIAGFWTDHVLNLWHDRLALRVITAIGFATGLGGLVILAHVRGDILILGLRQAFAAMDPNAVQATLAEAVRFYETAGGRLQVFFGLLAVSMELAGGLALHEALMAVSPTHELRAELERRLETIDAELLPLVGRVAWLKRDAAIFECQARRDFALGLLHGAKRNYLTQAVRTASRIAPLLLFATVLHGQTLCGIANDFSLTSGPKGYEPATAYEQNTAAAAEIIAHLPEGARFDVRGITDDSFAKPYPVLAGMIPVNDGRFPLFDPSAAARVRYAAAMRAAGSSIKRNVPID